jgi:cbb3-type cytochrome oxidase maturation protein
MSVIFLLLAASLGLGIGFLLAFVWAVRSGQMDDTVTPALRMLGEDGQAKAPNGGKQGERTDT